MIVSFLRWLFGYLDFEVTGKFPERFINLAAKRGINMWRLSGTKESFRASTKTAVYSELEEMAKKNGNEIHILKYHGLPHFFEMYKDRAGLLIGAVLFVAICLTMSGFVWNIKIDAPPELNEYEIRSELRKMGLIEGKWSKSIDTEKIERDLAVKNNKISWIAVNVLGSDVEVVISSKAEIGTKPENVNKASNLKSTADGTITRMEVRKGRAAVKIGDGVRKNQLLVSGILEYTNGSNSFVDSEAKIYAETSRSVEIQIPKTVNFINKEENSVTKKELSVFGLTIPIALGYRPSGSYIENTDKQQAIIFEKTLPVYLSSETFTEYKNQPVKINTLQAEKILNERIRLYEVFMLYSSDSAEIKLKKYSYSENNDFFIVKCDYIIEENICTKSVIEIS